MLQVTADLESVTKKIKTVRGRPMILVGTWTTKRRRQDEKIYIYHLEGTREIFYMHSRDGTVFMRIAVRRSDMERFYRTFVEPPLTQPEKDWAELYGYTVL